MRLMPRYVRGGYTTYGHPIGILMLDTAFPRVPGDVGHAATFEFPVLYQVVEGAAPDRLIVERDSALLSPFLEAARRLERSGVRAITSSCGFLALFQRELAEAVDVPVFSSALLLVPLVWRMGPPRRRIGIITANAGALGEEHFNAVGWSRDELPIHVVGLENEPLFLPTQRDPARFALVDVEALEAEVLRTVDRLIREAPDVGAIVLECTNLPPFAAAIQRRVARPVFDIVSLIRMVHGAVSQPIYE
jgi:hypothetical protein